MGLFTRERKRRERRKRWSAGGKAGEVALCAMYTGKSGQPGSEKVQIFHTGECFISLSCYCICICRVTGNTVIFTVGKMSDTYTFG